MFTKSVSGKSPQYIFLSKVFTHTQYSIYNTYLKLFMYVHLLHTINSI
jgi:hypothetical protein